MNKQIMVTFNYNSDTDTVSDVKCIIDGIEKKKRTTKKVKDIVEDNSDPLITLEANKLVFNNNAILQMNLAYEDRVIIKYEKKNNKIFPIIGKDLSFDEEGSGNKVTKSYTVGYRGNANTILSEYGTEFTIEEYKEGIWKLISTDNNLTNDKVTDSIEILIEKADNVEADLLIEGDENYKIDDFNFVIE
jgi:hypothetical protein